MEQSKLSTIPWTDIRGICFVFLGHLTKKQQLQNPNDVNLHLNMSSLLTTSGYLSVCPAPWASPPRRGPARSPRAHVLRGETRTAVWDAHGPRRQSPALLRIVWHEIPVRPESPPKAFFFLFLSEDNYASSQQSLGFLFPSPRVPELCVIYLYDRPSIVWISANWSDRSGGFVLLTAQILLMSRVRHCGLQRVRSKPSHAEHRHPTWTLSRRHVRKKKVFRTYLAHKKRRCIQLQQVNQTRDRKWDSACTKMHAFVQRWPPGPGRPIESAGYHAGVLVVD